MGSLRSWRRKTKQDLEIYTFVKTLAKHHFSLINEHWTHFHFVTLTFRHPMSKEGVTVMIDFKNNQFVPLYYPSHIEWCEGFSTGTKPFSIEDSVHNTVREVIEKGRIRRWSRE